MENIKLYKLNWDFTHSGDNEFDATHHPFFESENTIHYLMNPERHELSKVKNPILFQADFSIISKYDYLTNSLRIPILSERVIEIIISKNKIDLFDIIMVDDTYMEERFDANKNLRPEVPTINEFKTFRFRQTENYINLDQSEYRPLRSNPNAPGKINKLILNIPTEGFKPIFRTKWIPSSIILTEELKTEFEDKEIKGFMYEELNYEPSAK